jgi:hypothetical protein
MKIDDKLTVEVINDVEMTDLTKPESMEVNENGMDTSEGQVQDKCTEEATVNAADVNIDHKTYCKLGHFHLLLEDYDKGE